MGGSGKATSPANPQRAGNPHNNPPADLDEAAYDAALTARAEAEAQARAPVVARLNPAYDRWYDSITLPESRTLLAYQQAEYRRINGQLRVASGRPLDTLPSREVDLAVDPADVARLDAVIARGTLPETVTVYRGMRRSTPVATARQWVGSTMRDDAFLSTSLSPAVAEDFAYDGAYNGTVYQITVPAGRPAAWLDRHRSREEAEILLPRSSRFTVTDVSQRAMPGRQGQFFTVIHLTALPAHADR